MTPEETRDLIAEARLAACSECSEEGTSPAMRCDGDLIRRLADALAALTAPQEDVRGVQRRMLAILNSPEVWDVGEEPAIFLPERAVAELFAAFPALSRSEEGEWVYEVSYSNSSAPSLDVIDAVTAPLDPEKMAEALLRLMREEAMLFVDSGGEEWIAESDPVECLPPLARDLCEAFEKGDLT